MDGEVIAVNSTEPEAPAGTALITADKVDGSTQLWRFTADGYLQSVYYSLVVDRYTTANLIYAVLNTEDGAVQEFWTYNSTEMTIVSEVNDGYVLDVYSALYGSDVPVIVYRDKQSPEYLANQQWILQFEGLDD